MLWGRRRWCHLLVACPIASSANGVSPSDNQALPVRGLGHQLAHKRFDNTLPENIIGQANEVGLFNNHYVCRDAKTLDASRGDHRDLAGRA